jgi:conjugal transfer mating pair stabilization protein TraN
MSCEKPRSDNYEIDVVGFDDNDKRAPTRLICTNFPCIDGSCVNQTSKPNAEMMESLSKLSAVSKVKGGNLEVRIFEGKDKYCNNTRLLAYHDCCKIKGWGKFLGARCSTDEEDLINLRKANKCIYVGKRDSKLLGIVTTVTRNGWCCFNTVLDKLVQEQGRAQLGMNFGTGNDLDCRGLTIREILKLDFNKMDFKDFYAEILKKTKIPEIKDMDQKIKDALPDIKTYDKDKTDYENQRSGINNSSNVKEGNYGN